MTASPHEILSVAACVWDQRTHNDADMAFLDAIARADKDWIEQLSAAKIQFGPGEVFEATKRLATRQRNAAYAVAMAAFEASDDIEFQQAAE